MKKVNTLVTQLWNSAYVNTSLWCSLTFSSSLPQVSLAGSVDSLILAIWGTLHIWLAQSTFCTFFIFYSTTAAICLMWPAVIMALCVVHIWALYYYSTMTPRRWHTSRFVAHLLTFASGGPSRQVRPPLLVSHNWPSVNTVSTAACPGSHSTHTGGTTRTPLGPPFWHSYVPTRWGP